MTRILMAAAAALFVSAASADEVAPPTQPQEQAAQCGQYEQMADWLATAYNEHSVGIGIGLGGAVPDGDLMEFFVSPEKTWTVVSIDENLIACIVADGNFWTGDILIPGNGRNA